MTKCDETLELPSAYLDGELPAAERGELEAHLAACADCRRRLEGMRALKHAIARLPSREEPPGAVRARVQALRFGDRRRPVRRLASWAAAAALVVAISLAALFASRRAYRSSDLAEELVGDHLRSVPEAMPAEVASRDPEEVLRFFAARISFRPLVPRLTGADLVGGRLCKIAGRRVELLFYDRSGQTLSLFVSDQALGEPGCREARGHHVCVRREGDLTLLLIGKLPAAELRRVLTEMTA